MNDEVRSVYNKGWNDCNKYWFNTIKEQPKVGEWIPVDKRLPDVDIEVLVSCKSRITKYSYIDIDYLSKKNDKWAHFGEDVIAWQSLPELYRKEE